MRPISVVLGEDHPIYRAGLVEALAEDARLCLRAACTDGAAALAAVREHAPDVALLDFRMPVLDGLEVLGALRADGSRTRVLLLSAFDEGDVLFRALDAGVAGFLSKQDEREDICEALLAVADGDVVVSPVLHGRLFERARTGLPQAAGHAKLSDREREVLVLTADGMSGREIAEYLGIGPTTVKTHLSRTYRKLGVSDRAAMVAAAMRGGLLT